MIPFLVEITMSENDRKMLIVLLVLLVLVFILIGLVGMLIRAILILQGKKIDNYMHDPVVYRVIADPAHFKKYGIATNHRLLYKEAMPAFIIGFISLAFYIIYSLIVASKPNMGWNQNYFAEFGDLLYTWKWDDPDSHAVFWGISVLSKWPPFENTPHWVNDHWASYVLVPLWITAIVYYAICIQAYIARMIVIFRRARTVYAKSLEGYNYYDTMPKNDFGAPIDPGSRFQNVPPSANPPSGTNIQKK